MKIVSIIMLSFVLFINNTVMAETTEKKPKAKDFKQMKARSLQAATNHIEVLTKFKSCVQATKSGPELIVCRKQKKNAIKALRMKNRKAQAKNKKNGS